MGWGLGGWSDVDRGKVEKWSRHRKQGSCLPLSQVSGSTNSLIVCFVCSDQLCCFLVTVPAGALLPSYQTTSLEPRLSVSDFVLQLWREAARQNLERKAWVRGYQTTVLLYLVLFCINTSHFKNKKFLIAKRFDYPAAVLFSGNREHERYSW